jgi:hypothetical protein
MDDVLLDQRSTLAWPAGWAGQPAYRIDVTGFRRFMEPGIF